MPSCSLIGWGEQGCMRITLTSHYGFLGKPQWSQRFTSAFCRIKQASTLQGGQGLQNPTSIPSAHWHEEERQEKTHHKNRNWGHLQNQHQTADWSPVVKFPLLLNDTSQLPIVLFCYCTVFTRQQMCVTSVLRDFHKTFSGICLGISG